MTDAGRLGAISALSVIAWGIIIAMAYVAVLLIQAL